MPDLVYRDTATFVKVSSDGYGSNKTATQQVDIPVIFIQNTQAAQNRFQDEIEADAFCYPDPSDAFITENYHRLEGMFVLQPLFGAADTISWYKVIDVTTNRNHLLGTVTDNIELRLKKTEPIPGVS